MKPDAVVFFTPSGRIVVGDESVVYETTNFYTNEPVEHDITITTLGLIIFEHVSKQRYAEHAASCPRCSTPVPNKLDPKVYEEV